VEGMHARPGVGFDMDHPLAHPAPMHIDSNPAWSSRTQRQRMLRQPAEQPVDDSSV
jgi:hypothetical protein